MPAYTDQLLTTLVKAAGALIVKVGGAVGGSLNFLGPLTAVRNATTGDVDVGLSGTALPPSLATVGFYLLGGVSGSADVAPVPIFRNATGAPVTFNGADIWPSTNKAHDGTNYETIALLVYSGTTLTGSPTSPGVITTASVDWVAQTPLAFSGSSFVVPAGGTLAFNVTKTGTGMTLPAFSLWMR